MPFAGHGLNDPAPKNRELQKEKCKNITTINCSGNYISEIRLPGLTKLSSLICYGNPIEVLDLSNCSALREIFIPLSVEEIAPQAFWNCTSLQSATLSANIKSIGDNAFARCFALNSVYIGTNADVELGNDVFDQCPRLKSVTIGKKQIILKKKSMPLVTHPRDMDLSRIVQLIQFPTNIIMAHSHLFLTQVQPHSLVTKDINLQKR
jgi:hypothetical protein